MNAIVVYDSKFGNTERLALVIAGALGGAKSVRVDPGVPVDLRGVDLLVIGAPTQAWNATPAIHTFLKDIPAQQLRDLPVACFDTRFDKPRWLTGSAAQRIAGKLRAAGAAFVVPPESFFVVASEGPLKTGEIERAIGWGQMIREHVEKPVAAVQR